MTFHRQRPPPIFANVRGHHFLAHAIRSDSVVLDLGANRGEFAKELNARFGCSATLVEANPDLYGQLSDDGKFPTLHCAAGVAEGTVSFNVARNDEASSVLPLPAASAYGCDHVRTVTVPAMTLRAIMERANVDRLDLLKLDIEGAEVAVLETCPADVLGKISQITVEFHCDPSFGYGGRDRVVAVMHRLASLGFSQYTFAGDFTDVLFVNHPILQTGYLRRAGLRIWMIQWRWLAALWRALPATLRERIKKEFSSLKPR